MNYAILGAVILGLLEILHRKNRRIRGLTEAIDSFLLDETPLPISTEDSELGHLQTNISELQNRVLQQKEATRQEGRSNTQFISDISHQLKTPLAGLRLYCEMDGGDHAKKELALVEKMEKLIQNVLTLEKIRSDTYEMNFTPCPVSELARGVVSELQPLFPGKSLRLVGEANLRLDRGWMQEALGNVVKNACEHTPDQGWVEIRMEQREKSVEISVSDNGGGVKEEELPRLFDRFHRTENAIPSSAGIGLAITKAIVEKHHGIITAENTGEGLCISLCLPIIDANLKV